MNSPETAPKDKPILIDVGLPWLVVGIWCGASNKWVYANVQSGMYEVVWDDTYFENEYADELVGWVELPEKEVVCGTD